MSLINETLRDLDQRDVEPGGAAPERRPLRPRAGPRRPVVIPRRAVGALVLAALLLLAGLNAPALRAWGRKFALAPQAALPEAVSRLTADVASPPPPSPVPEPRFAAAPELRRLFVDGDREHVRVELEVSGSLAEEPRPHLRDGELHLMLRGARIGSALDPRSVAPVEAPWLSGLDLLEQEDGVVLRLSFDGEVDFRSRLVRREQGSRIALELSPVPDARRVRTPAPLPRMAAGDADALPAIPAPPRTMVARRAPPVSEARPSGNGARIEKTLRAPTPAERAEARVREARERLRAGEPAEAVALLNKALADAPGHAEARLALAGALVASGRRAEARAALEAAPGSSPPQASAKLLAGLLAEEGRSAEALDVLARAEPASVDDVELHALRGALLQELGQHEDALAAWRNVLRLSPHRADAWLGMGIALEALAQPEPAYTAYRAALRVGGLDETPARWAAGRVRALAP